jgi:hypothetical protein
LLVAAVTYSGHNLINKKNGEKETWIKKKEEKTTNLVMNS